MVLCKVVKSVPVPNTNGTATHTIGWYLVDMGQAVRVELWDVYKPKVCASEEEQKEENARVLTKQKKNWRKLEHISYCTVEGFDGLKEVIDFDETAYRQRLAIENEFSKK